LITYHLRRLAAAVADFDVRRLVVTKEHVRLPVIVAGEFIAAVLTIWFAAKGTV